MCIAEFWRPQPESCLFSFKYNRTKLHFSCGAHDPQEVLGTKWDVNINDVIYQGLERE